MRLEVVALRCPRPGRLALDHDARPPGSAGSVVLGEGLPLCEPGSVRGPQLCVDDLDAVRARLVERGVPVSEVEQRGPEGLPGSRFASFADPDGNAWSLQELPRSR